MPRGRRNEDDDDLPQLFEDIGEDGEDEEDPEYEGVQEDVEDEESEEEAQEENNILGFVPQAKRAIEAQATKSRTYKKQDRSGLTPKALSELAEKVMKGSEMKFRFLKIENEAESLKEIYDLGITIEWLKMELEKFDADDVFTIASKIVRNPSTDTLVPSKDAKKIDLFKKYNEVSLKTVVQNARLYKETGQEWHLENLDWSAAKVLNSCEDELRAKIVEDAAPIPSHLRTGPVLFKLMMMRIMFASREAVRSIESKLEKLTLKDFDGENVSNMASWIQGATRFLKANNATPYDEIGVVARALSTSSTSGYNQLVEMIYNNHRLGIKKTTVENILHHAVEDFNTRLAKNEWSVKDGKRKQSAFFSGNCHKCGKPGHMKKDCRVRSTGNNNASSNNRAGQGRSNGNNQGNGRNVNNGSAQQVNNGPREGSEQGHQQGNNGGNNRANNPKFKAPGPNEPQERNRNGRKEFWCNYHRRWSPTHGTNDCRANGNHQANVASNGSGSSSQVNSSATNESVQGNSNQRGQNDSASLAFLGGGWEFESRM